jgi:hypothetical protein
LGDGLSLQERALPVQPVRYTADLEQVEPAEELRIAGELAETMLDISRKTLADGGHGLRSVHAKSHALLKGRLEIEPGLPEVYAQGLFAGTGSHPVVLRFSSVPGDILPDSISTPRGLALKVLDVDGPHLPDADGKNVQDFVLVNAPAFSAPSPGAFLANLKLLAKTTDRVEPLKKAVSTVATGVERVIEAFGGQNPLLKTLGGELQNHPAGETYHSQTPLLWGDYVAKVSLAPRSENLRALAGRHVSVGGDPDGLRTAMLACFAGEGGEWEFRVQLCTDVSTMPIEDATTVWPGHESPHLRVGRIVVEPQEAWSPARATAIDDGLSFSPWHALVAHRPLGAINRARRVAYPRSARFRSEANGTPASAG